MKEYHAASTIQASPETIWQILTDASAYPDWEPGTISVEGQIAAGEKIKIFTKLSPNRAFPVPVTDFEPEQRMTWVGGMPMGLFKGERTFTLSPGAEGITEFSMQEVFPGPLLPLYGRTIPDLNPSFKQFASSLKELAERSD